MRELVCPTPEETVAAGRDLGSRLRPGMAVLLEGEPGAGKTTLAQGIAEGYGIRDVVTSPSFALINEYRTGDRFMVHFDPYRLDPTSAFHDLGWQDYLGGDALLVIEWPERLGEHVPTPHLRVRIEVADDGTRRLTLSSNPIDYCAAFRDVWR